MRFASLGVVSSSLAVVLCAAACTPPVEDVATGGQAHTRELLSQEYSIDRIYRSMQGPSSIQEVLLADSKKPELIWMTGFNAKIVGTEGDTGMSQEFMCHNNIDLNETLRSGLLSGPEVHAAAPLVTSSRVGTISQGLDEVSFPPGFGLPLPSIQPIFVSSQVLNHNLAGDELASPLKVRHKVQLRYVRDEEVTTPMKPLFAASVGIMVSLEGEAAYIDTLEPSDVEEASSCAPGEAAMHGDAHLYTDRHQRRFTAHWVVKPGREVRRTLVDNMLKLTDDTTVHYISVHLHPFAESLTLRDLTTGEDVFTSRATNSQDGVGLATVETLSSEEGIPIYKDHHYELVSVYNNTTDEDHDAMAVMNLFLADTRFDRERARAQLTELDQVIEAMDPQAYQRWLQLIRANAVPSQRATNVGDPGAG